MSTEEPVRVLLVDDHAVVRSGLAAFLMVHDDLELVGEASSGEEALQRVAESQPDVVLMDLVMPGMDGATATAAIRAAYPAVQIIVLTSFPEGELVQAALKAGALSYLLKNISAAQLAAAIRAARDGRSTLAPEAAQALVETVTQEPPLGNDLTVREREVLALMSEGLSNPQIAERLIVGRSTVKFHVSNILSKLRATSRTEAVALAVQHQLVP